MSVPAYRLARGVRLRSAEEGAMLLVPEGIVALNDTAAATLALVDGHRDVETIARQLAERFESDPSELRDDVRDLLTDLEERGMLVR